MRIGHLLHSATPYAYYIIHYIQLKTILKFIYAV